MDKFFETLSHEKQEFIHEFMNSKKPTDNNKAIPFIMNYVAMAKRKNIVFSKEEIIFLYNLYSNTFSPSEKEKLDKLFNTLK